MIYTHGMMKNPFFGRTQKLETTIASLVKRGDQLASKRAKAQDALEKATSGRQQALLAGDLDDQRALDKLQSAVDSAQSALTGIDDALAILARQKAEAEGALANEKQQAERVAAADALEKQIAAIDASAGPWLAQSRTYTDALTAPAHWHFGCDEMSKFMQSCMGQMETALNFQLAELKAMPSMIRDGRQPIPGDKPTPAPVVSEPVPETRRLFAMKAIKWTDGLGVKQYGQAFADHDVPLAAASRGLRCGALIPLDDPRCKKLRGARAGYHVGKHAALDLDDDAACRPSHIEPIMRSDPIAEANFIVTEGPTITGVISVART